MDSFYHGRIIKLQISCHTKIDPDEQTGCFLFKSEGHQILGENILLEESSLAVVSYF